MVPLNLISYRSSPTKGLSSLLFPFPPSEQTLSLSPSLSFSSPSDKQIPRAQEFSHISRLLRATSPAGNSLSLSLSHLCVYVSTYCSRFLSFFFSTLLAIHSLPLCFISPSERSPFLRELVVANRERRGGEGVEKLFKCFARQIFEGGAKKERSLRFIRSKD